MYKGVNTPFGHVRKEIEKGEGYPEGLLLCVQTKAWFDERVMLQWISVCWIPYIDNMRRELDEPGSLFYLILDECRTHLTPKVKNMFDDSNTVIEFIPGGYTSRLQTMDVGINKPFKGILHKNYNTWVIEHGYKKVVRTDVAGWIMRSWESITVATIQNSWRRMFGYENFTIEDDDDFDLLQ